MCYLSEAANCWRGPLDLYETPTPENFQPYQKNKSVNLSRNQNHGPSFRSKHQKKLSKPRKI